MNTIHIYLTVILCSIFIQIRAAHPIVSIENFLDILTRKLANQPYELIPIKSPPTENLVTIHMQMHASSPEILIFQVYDHQILMKGNDFLPDTEEIDDYDCELLSDSSSISISRASGGTRRVGICKTHMGNKLCFKQWPEAPIVDSMAYQLYGTIFPSHTNLPLPASIIILMNNQVFLVSKFIDGESLHDILNRVERRPDEGKRYTFNLQRFQALAFFCLLAVPEDCHTRNCFVRPILESESGECELAIIDWERSFGSIFTDIFDHPDKGPISTRTHCALFCFHELLKRPLNRNVREKIISSTLYSNMALCIESFSIVSNYQANLAEYIPDIHQGISILTMPISKQNMQSMFERLDGLQKFFTEHANSSMADAIECISPELFRVYRLAEYVPTPDEQILPKAFQHLCKAGDSRRHSSALAPPSAFFPPLGYFDSSSITVTPRTPPLSPRTPPLLRPLNTLQLLSQQESRAIPSVSRNPTKREALFLPIARALSLEMPDDA